MFERKSILAGILFFLNQIIVAQTISLEPIKKGDIIPNVLLDISRNNDSQKIHLYDVNKKLILLDFWSTNCSSCIAQMPHLQELQEKFKQVQIIVVTKNTKSEVNGLKDRLRGHASEHVSDAFNNLFFITGDSLLSFIFPHDGFPSHVWIDSSKKLEAIAYSNSTTNENIENYLAGKKIKLAEQGLRNIDRINPIAWLDADTGYMAQLKYYSFIFSRIEHTGGYDGQVFASTDAATGKVTAFNIVNAPITDLYKLAFFKYKHQNIGIPDNKIYLETKNTNRFNYPKNEAEYFEWADRNLYCYAVKVTQENADSVYTFMRAELDKFFKLKSSIEYRKVKCLVLKRTKSFKKLLTKSAISENGLVIDSKGSWLRLRNQPMPLLTSRIETLASYYNPFQPFFDETNFGGQINIAIPWNDDLNKIPLAQVKKALHAYGLDLREEYKILKMLVLSDK